MKWKIGNKTVDILPPVKRYMNAIERRLRADRATRARIMTELAGDFESRREAGQSDDQIMAELGTPNEVAAQFNAALGAPGRPSRWRWAFVALAVLVLAVVLGPDLVNRLTATHAASLGIIGGADGPTAIYVTAGPAAGISPLVFLPWLLGRAAGFWLPTWRNPHACKGYGPSLLLSGLGLLLLLPLAVLHQGGFQGDVVRDALLRGVTRHQQVLAEGVGGFGIVVSHGGLLLSCLSHWKYSTAERKSFMS